MSELVKIPAEAKEIIKNKRTGKIYASKADFDSDVADPNTDTTVDDFRPVSYTHLTLPTKRIV